MRTFFVSLALSTVLVGSTLAQEATPAAHVIAQASTGKAGREVSFLVCFNSDQVDVAMSALFVHESAGLIAHPFIVNAEGRTPINLALVPHMPPIGNFSVAVWMEAADGLDTAASCDLVYYSGVPLREIESRPLTARTYVKR